MAVSEDTEAPPVENHESHQIEILGGAYETFWGCKLCYSCECHAKIMLTKQCPFYYAKQK